jgi:hypothetical protein
MSFPTSPAFQSMSFQSILPTFVSTAISGRRQARQIAGQRWALTGTMPPMTRAQFAPIFAFCVSKRGMLDTFTVTPPVVSSRQATVTLGTPLANGAHSVGDRTIATDGWGADGVVLKAGDFIKFASHTKIYMVTADATASSNAVTVSIEPGIISAVADNNAITVNSVPFTVSLANSVQEIYTNATGLYSYEIDFIEVF